MTIAERLIYNAAARAAVVGDRRMLARALVLARRWGRPLYHASVIKASFVGWPVRRRPNGRYK